MDWSYPRSATAEANADGMEELFARLAAELAGPPLSGTRFLYDDREMMRATREIELAAAGRLLVGFQRAEKLERERSTYATIAARGVDVIAFGAGRPDEVDGVRWVEVPLDVRELETQWFLVVSEPEPLAFVSYDLSPLERFGIGGVSDPERRFAGFVSQDPRVIDALVSHLMGVAGSGPGRGAPLPPDIVRVVEGSSQILVATDDVADGPSSGARTGALGVAAAVGADLVLYDRSAESYFVDPYPFPETAEGDHPLEEREVRSLGRAYLADQIREAREAGVQARAWLPRGRGPKGMAEFLARHPAGVVVLPDTIANPSLFDRVRGDVLGRWIDAVRVPVLLASSGGTLRLADEPIAIPA